MYDVVIIGAGPAGISAGIYAASRGKKVLITEKNTVGGLIGKVSTVTHFLLVVIGIVLLPHYHPIQSIYEVQMFHL